MAKLEFGQSDNENESVSKKSSVKKDEIYDHDSEESEGGMSGLMKSKKFWGVVAFAAFVIFVMVINYPG